MMLRPCAREKEIAELLRLGHWPAAASEDLRAHVSGCRSCSDLVLVTESLQQARERVGASVRLQAPGVLWWRAQLRRRSAAVERIDKPILGAQIFAFAITLLCAVGFAVFEATRGFRWLSWFADLSASQISFMEAMRSVASAASGWSLMVVVPGAIALALMGGIVLYFAADNR
jgi:hypothetical protein